MMERVGNSIRLVTSWNNGHAFHFVKIVGHSGHKVVEAGDDMGNGAGGQNAVNKRNAVCNAVDGLALEREDVDVVGNLCRRGMSHSNCCESKRGESAEGDHFDDWNRCIIDYWCKDRL
jgi:hypothetical protein